MVGCEDGETTASTIVPPSPPALEPRRRTPSCTWTARRRCSFARALHRRLARASCAVKSAHQRARTSPTGGTQAAYDSAEATHGRVFTGGPRSRYPWWVKIITVTRILTFWQKRSAPSRSPVGVESDAPIVAVNAKGACTTDSCCILVHKDNYKDRLYRASSISLSTRI
jgi:hypothetical protein